MSTILHGILTPNLNHNHNHQDIQHLILQSSNNGQQKDNHQTATIHNPTIIGRAAPLYWIPAKMGCNPNNNLKQHANIMSLATLYYYLRICYSRFLILHGETK
jgi:hypothetical protein